MLACIGDKLEVNIQCPHAYYRNKRHWYALLPVFLESLDEVAEYVPFLSLSNFQGNIMCRNC